MKKIFILVLMVLVGVGLFLNSIKAEETRTISHKFRAFSADTEGVQGMTIFRITGYTTASNATFAIHDVATLEDTGLTNAAVEGGEATSGDALPHMYFGENGITLGNVTVNVEGCVIVVEYI